MTQKEKIEELRDLLAETQESEAYANKEAKEWKELASEKHEKVAQGEKRICELEEINATLKNALDTMSILASKIGDD